jgi:hypothetical protein
MAQNGVVEYVREVYDTFKQQRQPLEDPWSLAYDSFRATYDESNLSKWKALEGHDWRSKVFIRFARRKVLSSVAQINDIQFQAGQLPFNLSPIKDGSMQLMLPPEMLQDRAQNMKQRIESLLQLQKYERVLMASNLECAIYGMSVHKSPVLRPKRSISYQFQVPRIASFVPPPIKAMFAEKFGRHMPIESTQYVPYVEHVNLWDYFWDLEASGDDPGTADIQRVMMDAGMIRRLEELPGFKSEKIDEVLAAYSDTTSTGARSDESPGRQRLRMRRRGIEVMEFRGRIPKTDLNPDLHEQAVFEAKDHDGREVEVITTIAFIAGSGKSGIEICPAQVNPMPLQSRGFHRAYWESLPHEKQGIGICENVQDSQIMQNGFWRCFIDNSALSSNLLRFYKSGAFKPGQDMNLRPGAGYELEDWVRDVREAVQWVAPPYIGQQMIEALNVAERLGDEESGHPKMLQGETARHAPNTAFESSQLLEAANRQQGQIIKNIDEGHIEPDVESLYHYEMTTNPDESLKGPFECQATGFSAYNDKVRKSQTIMRLFGMFMGNPQTAAKMKIDPTMRQAYQLSDLDPDEFILSDDEVEQKTAQMAQMLQPPPGRGGPGMPPQGGPAGEIPPSPSELPHPGMNPRGKSMIQVPGRAMGGPVEEGKPYVVGEQGPELIVPQQDGTVIPNQDVGGGYAANITTTERIAPRGDLISKLHNMREYGYPGLWDDRMSYQDKLSYLIDSQREQLSSDPQNAVLRDTLMKNRNLLRQFEQDNGPGEGGLQQFHLPEYAEPIGYTPDQQSGQGINRISLAQSHGQSAPIKTYRIGNMVYMGNVPIPGNLLLEQVLEENKGLAGTHNKDNTKVVFADQDRIAKAKKLMGNPKLEYWPDTEGGTPDWPHPEKGKHVLEVYDESLKDDPNALKNAIYGDLIHGMSRDPYFARLKSEFMQSFTPEELERQAKKRTWWEDVNGPGDNPARYDAYIRGWLGGDAESAREGQEKSGNTMYSPKQIEILRMMEDYIKNGAPQQNG